MDGYKVVLTRNGVEESFHDINIVHSKSPESFGYFPRSAIKPFQLIPLVHELLKKKIEIDLSEIAILKNLNKLMQYQSIYVMIDHFQYSVRFLLTAAPLLQKKKN